MSMTTVALPLPSFEHDCQACSGLCCVVLPFDADQGFGFDKAAHTPCQHLKDDFLCGIHAGLEAQGFRGCIHFSCHGAGQRVTRLFGATHWRGAPERAEAIYAVFKRMQKLHELQFLLHTASMKIDNLEWRQRLASQQQRLELLCQQVEAQHSVDMDAATAQTLTLLRQLATEPAIVALRDQQSPRG
jgi:hypothetical protein